MRRLKRTLSTLAAAALLTTLTLTGAHAITYQDVPGHWAEAQIMRWSNLGYLTGYGDGIFGPDDNISRGQLAVILTNLMGYTDEAENTFGLAGDAWYLHYILKAAQAGILPEGWENTPSDQGITREEAMYILAQASGMKLVEGDPGVYYNDADQVSDWAAAAVYTLRLVGYVGGYPDGGVHPQATLTRAEVVTILNNIYPNIYSTAGTYQKNVTGTAVVNTGNVTLREMTIDGDLLLTEGTRGQTVTLDHVTVTGEIVNLGGAKVVLRNDQYSGDTFEFGSKTVTVPTGARANTYSAERFTQDENGWRTYSSDYYEVQAGIDVSSYQGEIDWQAVADSGIQFAMIRLGYRGYGMAGNLRLDEWFHTNIQAAQQAGLKVGVYFFSQATSVEEAEDEALFVLNQLRGYTLDYPVIFDWETISYDTARTDQVEAETVNQCAAAFVRRIQQGGYSAGVYFYKSQGYFTYDQAQLSDYYTWYCGLGETPGYYYDFRMWQYSHTGSVPGIQGNVDLDLAFSLR